MFEAEIGIPNGSITNDMLATNLEMSYTKQAQRPFMESPIPLALCRVWDAMQTNTPGTAASDDLALITGTPGTNAPKISAGDCKAATVTRKLAFELEVPPNYDDGQSFQVRLRCAMETTVSDNTCTVDLSAYKPNGSGGVGSDLVTTSAQSINSLTPADKDFVIDETQLNPSDKLICVVTIACADSATATAVTPVIYAMSRRVDTRG